MLALSPNICICFSLRFMSIYDVSTYVKARSWLIKFKKILTLLEYHKDTGYFIPYG